MWGIFKDDNEWNEKNVVGFIAFLVMVAFALADYETTFNKIGWRAFHNLKDYILKQKTNG